MRRIHLVMSTPEQRTYQDTKEAPCTILEGPWSIHIGAGGEPPHSVVCHVYGSGYGPIQIHGEAWSYGQRWNDERMYSEITEMIRQAPEVRKERDDYREKWGKLVELNGYLESDFQRKADECDRLREIVAGLEDQLISYQTAR